MSTELIDVFGLNFIFNVKFPCKIVLYLLNHVGWKGVHVPDSTHKTSLCSMCVCVCGCLTRQIHSSRREWICARCEFISISSYLRTRRVFFSLSVGFILFHSPFLYSIKLVRDCAWSRTQLDYFLTETQLRFECERRSEIERDIEREREKKVLFFLSHLVNIWKGS